MFQALCARQRLFFSLQLPVFSGLLLGALSGVIQTPYVRILPLTPAQATRGIILQRQGIYDWFEFNRGARLQARDVFLPTPREKVNASAIAGGITGGVLAPLVRTCIDLPSLSRGRALMRS